MIMNVKSFGVFYVVIKVIDEMVWCVFECFGVDLIIWFEYDMGVCFVR